MYESNDYKASKLKDQMDNTRGVTRHHSQDHMILWPSAC